MIYLLIFLGGGMGCVARAIVSAEFHVQLKSSIPWGTAVVNIAGSFLIGIVLAILTQPDTTSTQWRFFLATGFLGGFTTFSTFSWETLHLLSSGNWMEALINILVNLFGCLLGTFLGYLLVKGIS